MRPARMFTVTTFEEQCTGVLGQGSKAINLKKNGIRIGKEKKITPLLFINDMI